MRESSVTAPNSKAQARLIQLDILRGIAILLVLGCHFTRYVTADNGVSAGWLKPLDGFLYFFGWAGVDLFFVLSGFLVGGLLFKELRTRSHLDVRRFWIRRAFKIWPLYFVYVGLLFAWSLAHHPPLVAIGEWLPNLVHLQNYDWNPPRPHTWSLAVEEHFYLLLPLLLCLAARRRKATASATTDDGSGFALRSLPAVPVIAGMVIIGCTLGRAFVYARNLTLLHHFTPDVQTHSFTHLRLDSLFFGVLLAYWHHFKPQRVAFAAPHAGKLLVLGLALIAPMMFLPPDGHFFVPTFGYTLLYFGFGAILLAFVHTQPGAGPLGRALQSSAARGLAFIGVFSYPIYLWHYDAATLPVQWMARHGILGSLSPEARWIGLAIIHVVLAIGCGIFWSLLLEKPALALRDRWFPRRADALAEGIEAGNSPARLPLGLRLIFKG